MIQISNVSKKYGDTVILKDASYSFPEKGIVCLMGASGGGKTTLLNLLAGFDTDYEGEILVGGKSISEMDADSLCRYRCDNIGFVFQNYHLLPGYTVLDNVQIASELSETLGKESQQRATTLLTRLGIEQQISAMIRYENLMLSSLATAVNLILLSVSIVIGKMMGYTLIFSGVQIILSVVATFIIVMTMSSIVSYKLIRTEPAVALRK